MAIAPGTNSPSGTSAAESLRDLGLPDPKGSAPVFPSRRIAKERYDPARDRESIRGKIAMTLILTLVGIALIVVAVGLATALVCAWSACTAEAAEMKSARAVVELVLTPLIGLVGAVTGFYFGEKSGGDRPRQ
jgi:hypothetical protein